MWLLLQLADSALPTGGFAHSSGLEAAVQQGEAKDLRRFLHEALWQAGHGALPLASAAHADPGELERLDARADSFLVNHVANRASRVQGRAFLETCARIFPELQPLRGRGRHHAPIFGAGLNLLGLELPQMQQLLLAQTVRGICAAAVRLGIAGTHEAQRLQRELAPLLDEVLGACAPLRSPVQTAPLLDLFASTHDRLYSRLFQS
jgi:urease accessory protein